MEFFKSFDFTFTLFNAIQLVPFCLVSFSLVCSFQVVNKWIHSFVKQFDQGEAAAKIDSFYVRLLVNQTGDPCTIIVSFQSSQFPTNMVVVMRTNGLMNFNLQSQIFQNSNALI